jgi:hypothetical protein
MSNEDPFLAIMYLTDVVRNSEAIIKTKSEERIILSTGDGMAAA